MSFVMRAQILLGMMGTLIAAIKAVEEAIPGQGHGEQKLAAIRAVLEQAHAGASDVAEKFDAIWPSVAGVVKTLVGVFNAKGIFRKG